MMMTMLCNRGVTVRACLLGAVLVCIAAGATITHKSSSAWGTSADGVSLERGSSSSQGTQLTPVLLGERSSFGGRQRTQLGNRASFGSGGQRQGDTTSFGSGGQRQAAPLDAPAFSGLNSVGGAGSILAGIRPGQPLFRAPDLHALVPQLMRQTFPSLVGGGAHRASSSDVTLVQQTNPGDGVSFNQASDNSVQRETGTRRDGQTNTLATSVQSIH